MADNGDFKLQISYKLGPNYADMLNVRAGSVTELDDILGAITEDSDGSVIQSLLEVGHLLRGASNAGPLLVPQQAAPASDIPPTRAVAPISGQACQHGEMVYREAKPGSGKSWKAFFCPAEKGDPSQCKARFLDSK